MANRKTAKKRLYEERKKYQQLLDTIQDTDVPESEKDISPTHDAGTHI